MKVKRTQKRRPRPNLDAKRVADITLPAGLPDTADIVDELDEMRDVLMGRQEPPIWKGIITLQEVATAYLARALEITMLIQEGEREGDIIRGSSYYRLRTGELRTFIDLAKRMAELGSRRITAAQIREDLTTDADEAELYED